MDLKIDPEFRAQIPPLSEDERAEVERSIIDEGVRDRLVVWAGHGILLDDHNRYEIATKHGIAFDVAEREFADRSAAADWIDRNQLGRRNLKPGQMSLLRGRVYNRKKGPWGMAKGSRLKRGEGHLKSRCQSDSRVTASLLAAEFGVHAATIANDGRFASAVETLKPLLPDLERLIISGSGPTRKDVIAAASAEPAIALELLAPKPAACDQQRQPRRFNGVPLAEKVARFMRSNLVSAEALEREDVSSLIGTDQACELIGQARRARSSLRTVIANLEGK